MLRQVMQSEGLEWQMFDGTDSLAMEAIDEDRVLLTIWNIEDDQFDPPNR